MQSRRIVRTLLADLFFFGFLHGAMSFAAFLLLGDARPFLTALILLAPFYGMTAVRLKADKAGFFLLGHILLCFVPVFFGVGRSLRGFLFLFLLICMLYSCVVRLRGDWYPDIGVTAFLVGLGAALALVADYFAFRQPERVLFFWAFIMALAGMICRQTAGVDGSLAILSGAVRQPVETTMRYGNFILAAFLVPVGLAGLLAAFLPLSTLGRMLIDGLLALYRFFYELIMRLFAALFGGGEMIEQPPSPPPDLAAMVPEAREAPAWLQIVERVFIALIWTAVAVLLVYGAAKGLGALYRQFYKARRTDGELREYIGPELRLESLWRKLRRVRRALPAFGESEEERVRRRYYLRVRRHIRRGVGVRPSDAAGDIERRLHGREDVAALTTQYNRARYRIKPGKKK